MQRPPIPPPSGEVSPYPYGPAPDNIIAVAKAQQLVLLSVVFTIVSFLVQNGVGNAMRAARAGGPAAMPVGMAGIALVIMIAVTGFRLYSIYKLGRALQIGWTIVAVVVSLIPCLGLIMLLVINSQATALLRSAGISVGLMGANNADLERYRQNQQGTPGGTPWS